MSRKNNRREILALVIARAKAFTPYNQSGRFTNGAVGFSMFTIKPANDMEEFDASVSRCIANSTLAQITTPERMREIEQEIALQRAAISRRII